MSTKKSLWQLSVTLSIGVALNFISGWSTTAYAQYQAPQDDGFQSNEQDSMFGGSASGINPLELMNRIQLSRERSLEEFSDDSATTIKDSASEFKRLQQERLNQQQSPFSVEYTPEKE